MRRMEKTRFNVSWLRAHKRKIILWDVLSRVQVFSHEVHQKQTRVFQTQKFVCSVRLKSLVKHKFVYCCCLSETKTEIFFIRLSYILGLWRFVHTPLCLVNFQFSTLCSCVASLRNGAETHIGHFLVVWPHFCLLTIYREKYEGLWKWTFLKTNYKSANLRNPPLLPFWRTVGRYRSMSFLENTSTRTITWWKQITKLVLTSNMATQGAIKRHKQIGFHFPTQASRNSVHKPKEKVHKGCLWDLYVKTL